MIIEIYKETGNNVFFVALAKIKQVWSSTNIDHIFVVIVRQICITQSIQQKWHFSLLRTFSSKNTSLFIFTHFWWNHFSQTEQHAINKSLSFQDHYRQISNDICKTHLYVMYDLHLFECFVIFANGLNLFCLNHSFRWVCITSVL